MTNTYWLLYFHRRFTYLLKKEKKKPVSRNSAKSKCRAMIVTCCEISWLLSLFQELELPHSQHVLLYCDNQVVINISTNLVFHEMTKYMELDCYLVRENASYNYQDILCSFKVSTYDLFTKPLGSYVFHKLLGKMNIVNVHAPP